VGVYSPQRKEGYMGTQPKTHPRHADPVRVDSKHYTVEFENEQIRVLRIKYGPREKSVMHSHPPLVGIFLTDHHSRFSYPGGRTEELKAKAGDVKYLDAFEHDPENLSDKPFEVIAVELKQPKR
jgi:hypothetical protein